MLTIVRNISQYLYETSSHARERHKKCARNHNQHLAAVLRQQRRPLPTIAHGGFARLAARYATAGPSRVRVVAGSLPPAAMPEAPVPKVHPCLRARCGLLASTAQQVHNISCLHKLHSCLDDHETSALAEKFDTPCLSSSRQLHLPYEAASNSMQPTTYTQCCAGKGLGGRWRAL